MGAPGPALSRKRTLSIGCATFAVKEPERAQVRGCSKTHIFAGTAVAVGDPQPRHSVLHTFARVCISEASQLLGLIRPVLQSLLHSFTHCCFDYSIKHVEKDGTEDDKQNN